MVVVEFKDSNNSRTALILDRQYEFNHCNLSCLYSAVRQMLDKFGCPTSETEFSIRRFFKRKRYDKLINIESDQKKFLIKRLSKEELLQKLKYGPKNEAFRGRWG